MKKKIIIISVLVLLIGGIIAFLIINNNKNSKNNNSSKTTTTSNKALDNSLDYNYDFKDYETIDVNLDDVDGKYEITKTAIYHFTGNLKGYITVSSDENIKIIFDNVTITNSSGPCLYVENAKNLYVELIGNNTLKDGKSYSNFDEEVNAAIYSKDDLIISGDGTLSIVANYNDAIVSKDDLVIKSGTYKIESKDDAIKGKDSILILDGVFDITSSGDSLKTTNDTDSNLGSVLIKNGKFTINSTNGDGIDSINSIEIDNGDFNITTKITNSNSDSSAKGIKAENSIVINNITLKANTKDDAIHSNKGITINSGDFDITSTDDAIHADGKVEINDGKYNISASEGIEATYIKINKGTINISASDDGINAGKKSNDYEATVEINDGNITIKMANGDTDGIDSNGNLYINGGTINITCNSPFDYDGKAEYNGGTLIVNGTKTNEITNQMMGGGMPLENMRDNNMRGGMNRR